MAIIESKEIIAAAQAPLFWLSQDYYLRTEWDPFTKENRFLDGAKTPGKGVRVFVKTYNHLTMTAVLANFEPPFRATMVMERGPFMFKTFSGTWTFKPLSPASTEAIFRYNVQLRNRFLEKAVGFITYWILRRDIKKRLQALKYAAEKTDLISRLTHESGWEKI